MKTRKLKLDNLNPYYKNARRGNIDAIAESLQVNGQYKPIVVNEGTLTGRPWEILVGNHTAQAATAIGLDALDAVVVDVDEEKARRIVLADNRTSDLGSYDESLLADLLQGGADLDGTGFTSDDLDLLVRSLGNLERNDAGYVDKTDPEAEWEGMPEFDMIDQTPEKQLIVSFRTMDDYRAFANFIGQSVTDKTKSIWYPESKVDYIADMVYTAAADDADVLTEHRPEA